MRRLWLALVLSWAAADMGAQSIGYSRTTDVAKLLPKGATIRYLKPAVPVCPCFARTGTYGIDTITCGAPDTVGCEDDILVELGATVEVGVMRRCGGTTPMWAAGITGGAGPNCYVATTGGTTLLENLTQAQEDACKVVIQGSAAYATGGCP